MKLNIWIRLRLLKALNVLLNTMDFILWLMPQQQRFLKNEIKGLERDSSSYYLTPLVNISIVYSTVILIQDINFSALVCNY